MKQVLIICIVLIIGFDIYAQDTRTISYFNKDSVTVKKIEPFNYVVIERQGSLNQIGPLFSLLWEEMIKQFLSSDNTWNFFTVFYNLPNDTPEKDLRWGLGSRYAEDEEVYSPLTKKRWNYKKIVSVKFNGPVTETWNVYNKTIEWIKENDHKDVGPPIQRIRNYQTNTEGVGIADVELWIPIEVSE